MESACNQGGSTVRPDDSRLAGAAGAPAYQLWLSAVGLQPQDNRIFELTYPWLGFRVGVIGDLKVKKR